jgi:lysine 2,3-aminomutase
MLIKISKHLQKLAQKSKAIRKQFYSSSEEEKYSLRAFVDPLLEDQFKPVKGLVHKYSTRVLIELTLNCASFCRFCTRRRRVSDIRKGKLSKKDIGKMIDYVKSRPKINEIIFSGGDPLVVPKLLIYSLNKFSKLKQIKILRVHTRVPVSDPRLLTKEILNALSEAQKKKTLYLSIHFEHPDELTPKTIKAVKALKNTGAILLSQSVFLKGINDSYKVLEELFTKLAELGIRPYYIYHCDLVKGAEHFICPIKKEIEIMTKLRKNISGIAFPFHAVDTPNGSGKIPLPLNFWKFECSSFSDFENKKIKMH